MNLREAIQQLEQVVSDVRSAVFADDKTRLRNALALRDEASLIDSGRSMFDVIIFGDLNRFKGLNDRYGHDAGDIAINQAGEKLYQLVIEKLNAQAFHPSGDEFIILLKQEQLEAFVAEISSFAAISFIHRTESLKTAMSFGYAINDGKTSFDDLLARAEIACQHAKEQGDGFCVTWSLEIQRNQLVNFRERCKTCGARIICNVAQEKAPVRLTLCPCCGESL